MSDLVTRLRITSAGREIARSWRADSLWERFRGLMLCPPLPEGESLWLPACSSVHTAFVRAPIDVVFLRAQEIVAIRPAVPPWRIAACRGADSVWELGAGEAGCLELRPGQRLEVVSGGEREGAGA